jgi:hypothetical protein
MFSKMADAGIRVPLRTHAPLSLPRFRKRRWSRGGPKSVHMSVNAASTSACATVWLVTLHVEAHVFDVARLVEALQALGEGFDFVF